MHLNESAEEEEMEKPFHVSSSSGSSGSLALETFDSGGGGWVSVRELY